MIRLKRESFLLCLCAISLYPAQVYADHLRRPGELEIHYASSSDSACTFLTLRTTQTHKALKDFSDVHVVEGKLVDGIHTNEEHSGSFERFYSHDLALLWNKAISKCGPPADWSFPSHVKPDIVDILQMHPGSDYEGTEQATFTVPDSPAVASPAPIVEIVPLIQTGHPDNRIDFVFLGDGCKPVQSRNVQVTH